MLAALADKLLQIPGLLVQLDEPVPVALTEVFHRHEHQGPYGLRAGKTAPHPAHQHGDGKQGEGTDNQHPGQEHTVLGPEGHPEYMTLALGQVKQHGRTPVDKKPGDEEVSGNQRQTGIALQPLEEPSNFAGIDLVV